MDKKKDGQNNGRLKTSRCGLLKHDLLMVLTIMSGELACSLAVKTC